MGSQREAATLSPQSCQWAAERELGPGLLHLMAGWRPGEIQPVGLRRGREAPVSLGVVQGQSHRQPVPYPKTPVPDLLVCPMPGS